VHRIRLQGTRHHRVDDLVLERHIGFFGGLGGSGFQPAITRAQYRALALSRIPGNIRRSSSAAENSPPSLKAVRIAAASDSETQNIGKHELAALCEQAEPPVGGRATIRPG
jgi:hypothetical protein